MSNGRGTLREIVEQSARIYRDLHREEGTGIIIFRDHVDGICGCSIISWLLDQLGTKYHIACLDDVFPPYVELVEETGAEFVLLVDLGSGREDMLERVLSDSASVYLLDPHPSAEAKGRAPRIHRFDLRRVTATSASSLCFLVARNIGKEVNEVAWISVLGSGQVQGDALNVLAQRQATRLGDVTRKIVRDRERILVSVSGLDRERAALGRRVTTLAQVGYYEDGPVDAVTSLRFGDLDQLWSKADAPRERMKLMFDEVRGELERDGLFARTNVQWFDSKNSFSGLSPGIIADFADQVRNLRGIVHGDKYIAGLMSLEARVPGLGDVGDGWTRVCCSVPKRLEGMIQNDRRPPVSAIIEASAFHHGGYGKGSRTMGSALLPQEEVQPFIGAFDRLVDESLAT